MKTCLQCPVVREPEDFGLGKSNARRLGGWGRGLLRDSELGVRELGDSGAGELEGSDMWPLGDFGLGGPGLGKSDLGESGMRELRDSVVAPLRSSGMGPAGDCGIGLLGRRRPGTGQVTRQLSYSGGYEGSIRGYIEAAKIELIHHCSRRCIPSSWNLRIINDSHTSVKRAAVAK